VTGGVAPNKAGDLIISNGLSFHLTLGRGHLTAGMMTNNNDVANHKPVTEAVHEHGGVIAMQVLHTGRYSLS
jgi:2,4-dienoyl-CoA reductase (NADPH2)